MHPNANSTLLVRQEARAAKVSISPWVNEPLPDVQGILCSHDLARLTRRPRWMLCGLTLIGKFPRKKRFRGRVVGWCRAEVIEWMTRDLSVETQSRERLNASRHCAHRHPRQACLPLECRPSCVTNGDSRPQRTQR